MSTLKTNNIEHLDASTPSIQTTIGGGTILSGVSTVSGALNVGTGITFNTDGSATFVGIVSATSFTGDGSNLTGVSTITLPSVGTAPENIPINQYLGKQAFVDEVGTLRPYFPTGSFYSAPQTGGDIQFRYVSDTSIQIVMKGLDGTIRSTTLTLS